MMIRPLQREDLPALKEVVDSTGLFASEMLDAMTAPYFDGQRASGSWITIDDNAPIAVAYYVPEPMARGTWNLLLLAVRADQQRKGLGARLLRHIEQSLSAQEARLLLIETSSLPSFDNTRAFYRTCGYDQEARICNFYQAGEDKIVFTKTISRA